MKIKAKDVPGLAATLLARPALAALLVGAAVYVIEEVWVDIFRQRKT